MLHLASFYLHHLQHWAPGDESPSQTYTVASIQPQRGGIRVKRSLAPPSSGPATGGSSNVYVIPAHHHPHASYEPSVTSLPQQHVSDDSRDFDDLILALKTGSSHLHSNYAPSDYAVDREVEEVHFQNPAPSEYLDKRRIPIADTHL